MVEVDPIVLVAGAAAIAVLSVVSCARNNKPSGSDKEGEAKAKSEKKGKKNEGNNTSTQSSESALAAAPAPQAKSGKGKNNPTTTTGSVSGAASTPPTKVVAPVAAPVPTPAASKPAAAPPAKKAPVPEVVPAPEPDVVPETDKKKKAKETPEQKAARLERQKKRKEQQPVEGPAASSDPSQDERVEYVSRVPVTDVWEVVEDKRKQKPKKASAAPVVEPTSAVSSGADVPAAPEHITSKLTVDPKKIGIIIGPKGATLRSIQDLTEAIINMPKADRDSNAKSASISIVGSTDAVQNASNIIIELCTKGYSTRLEGENFQESHLSIHNQFLSEIIGKNGACIRAIQDKLSVRITIPPLVGKDSNAMVKIGIAGDRENIHRAKEVIREIMTYYHSPITHPGHVHVSLDIPPRMYNSIIGTKGGEIRHIQNNFKVNVHIPNPNSLTQHVIVVGENSSNQVDNAVRYIQKIVQQIVNEEAKTATVVETWNEQSDLLSSGEEAAEPEWVSQYMYNREASKQVNLMAAVNVPISLSTAESNAWKMGDAAEGW